MLDTALTERRATVGVDHAGYSRRQLLRAGTLASMPLSLAHLFASRRAAADDPTPRPTGFGSARQMIMLFLHGGHPQQETFDPKPDGPSAVRGEFSAIHTQIPGTLVSEVLPRTAQIVDRLAVIRSMTHDNPNHVQACLPAQTGHRHPNRFRGRGDFPPSATDFPPFGAVCHATQPRSNSLPNWVRIGPLMCRNNGTVLHGQTPGLLGPAHASFAVDQSLLPQDVTVQAIQPGADLTANRLGGRKTLLEQLDREQANLVSSPATRDLEIHYRRAFDLLSSTGTRAAFDLQSEHTTTRTRYGNTEFGQRCLLARRLAEAGVPVVNVSYCHTPRGSWDTHGGNFTKMRDSLGPTFDTAFTALVEDLEQRGMLDDTLVVVNAEFGRTPAINKSAGRDHWPWVYSLALAGAGIRRGCVFGASDASAAYPETHPRTPEDFAATLYHLLGVDPHTKIYDVLDRPHNLVNGRIITELLA